jgi:tryptophan synthase alpha chain
MFKHKSLIPFLMAGVPTLHDTENLAGALIEGGASVLEIGVPFSDPGADGVVLQKAAEIALAQDVNLTQILQTIKKIKVRYPHVGIVLFTYLNPLLAFGLEKYVAMAVESGVNATLTVDLPVEEADEYRRIHREGNLKTVFLASPTTSPERLEKIKEASTAFLYYVSRTGVTGVGKSEIPSFEKEIQILKRNFDRPVAIGFGISSPEDVAKVSEHFDGVIIGSAYMKMIMENENQASKIETFTKMCVGALFKEIT